MTLADLVARVQPVLRLTPAAGAPAVSSQQVTGLAYDSRRTAAGMLFVALAGQRADGNAFAADAIARGAIGVVSEVEPGKPVEVPWLVVADAKLALSTLADAFNLHPSRDLLVIGITGTNGKTTTSYLVESVLNHAGIRCGRLGTVTYDLGDQEQPAELTTPEAPELHGLLREMNRRGTTACVMEVSSHALALRRVDAIRFSGAVFTNLTRDHLDLHGSMERYFRAKQRLFELLPAGAPSAINVDDPHGLRLLDRVERAVTYGLSPKADVTTRMPQVDLGGLRLRVGTPIGVIEIDSPLLGRPNVYNILATVALGVALDVPTSAIASGIAAVTRIPGRLEIVSDASDDVTVIVDYAHTDDALRNVLETARGLTAGRLITAFGCGGDRDRTKRPLMGAVAARLADLVVLTSDNPRSEDPAAIIEEITKGIVAPSDRRPRRAGERGEEVVETPWIALVDRRAAIARAIGEAAPGDVVVVAGKGHERYQIIGDQVIAFDDSAVARGCLAARRRAGA